MRRRGRGFGVVAGLAAVAMLSAPAANAASLSGLAAKTSRLVDKTAAQHPNALWHIVHDLCVTDMKASGNPAPCSRVDLAGGYAVLKDIQGRTQYLLIPTARISGIESPALLAADSPNYWQAAWAARGLFERRAGALPRERIGLAINSQYGRTQNQLHIHIDCARADVVQTLAASEARITAHWTHLTLGPAGHRYRARWIEGANLGDNDPFKILARSDPLARDDMAKETLVVIGAARADGSPGFVLLAGRDGEDNDGAGEELLDHRCQAPRDADG